jgi:hypothetical protein
MTVSPENAEKSEDDSQKTNPYLPIDLLTEHVSCSWAKRLVVRYVLATLLYVTCLVFRHYSLITIEFTFLVAAVVQGLVLSILTFPTRLQSLVVCCWIPFPIFVPVLLFSNALWPELITLDPRQHGLELGVHLAMISTAMLCSIKCCQSTQCVGARAVQSNAHFAYFGWIIQAIVLFTLLVYAYWRIW